MHGLPVTSAACVYFTIDFGNEKLGGENGKTKARLANRGWLDDLKHI